MESDETPIFRDLERDECLEILRRNHIGRIAYAGKDLIDIQPVSYVYSDGWIYGRTSKGRKMETLGYSWAPVAFQVDEIEDPFRWKSVVVHGGFTAIPPRGTGWEIEEWNRGVELLRSLTPGAFGPDDPFPSRVILFRIEVGEVSGKSSTIDG